MARRIIMAVTNDLLTDLGSWGRRWAVRKATGNAHIPRGWNDKCKSLHFVDKPRLQYVPTGANQEIPT